MENLSDMIQQAQKDMRDAEDNLIETGFSEAQWLLIRRYILSAIDFNHLKVAERLKNLPNT